MKTWKFIDQDILCHQDQDNLSLDYFINEKSEESELAKDTESDLILKNNEIMNLIRILRKGVYQRELVIVNQIQKIKQAIFDDASKKQFKQN